MIALADVSKSFASSRGSVKAVDALSLELAPQQFTSILGPSGCGKTTTLRMIAGLERPDTGRVWLGDQLVYSATEGVDVPAHQRGLGIVFQSYAIWPHMNVAANVAYPLRVRRVPRGQRRERVAALLELVGLAGLADRPATQLSGGEQQRVALARALAAEPSVLLLDEPLSNLDAERRKQMRLELSQLQREVGTTTLYVTHDQDEALSLSDEVVVMDKGRLMQRGTPRELYHEPRNKFVATFVGATNLITARPARKLGEEPGFLDTDIGVLMVDGCARIDAASKEVAVSVRPESIRLSHRTETASTGDTERANRFTGHIERSHFTGDRVEHHVRVRETTLRVFTDGRDTATAGSAVTLEVAPEDCQVLADRPNGRGSSADSRNKRPTHAQ